MPRRKLSLSFFSFKKQLSIKFLNEVKNIWNNCAPLQNNDFNTLKNLVEYNNSLIKIDSYKELDLYGEYPVDFLFVLMLLLSTQEKTNRPDAYMFGSIIDEIRQVDNYLKHGQFGNAEKNLIDINSRFYRNDKIKGEIRGNFFRNKQLEIQALSELKIFS